MMAVVVVKHAVARRRKGAKNGNLLPKFNVVLAAPVHYLLRKMAAVAPPASPVRLISIKNKEEELILAPPRKRQRTHVAPADNEVHNPHKKLFAEHPPTLDELASRLGFVAITIGDKRGRY